MSSLPRPVFADTGESIEIGMTVFTHVPLIVHHLRRPYGVVIDRSVTNFHEIDGKLYPANFKAITTPCYKTRESALAVHPQYPELEKEQDVFPTIEAWIEQCGDEADPKIENVYRDHQIVSLRGESGRYYEILRPHERGWERLYSSSFSMNTIMGIIDVAIEEADLIGLTPIIPNWTPDVRTKLHPSAWCSDRYGRKVWGEYRGIMILWETDSHRGGHYEAMQRTETKGHWAMLSFSTATVSMMKEVIDSWLDRKEEQS